MAGREHVIAGSIFGGLPSFAELPPLIPIPEKGLAETGEAHPAAPAAAMEWETELVVHTVHWPQVDTDRRHSGWAEVEKRWARQQEQEQQQQQPPPPPLQQQQAGAAQTRGG